MTVALELLRRFWPYLVAAGVAGLLGFSTAWNIQGLLLTAAEQEFTQYKQDQIAAAITAAAVADKQREDAANEYRKLKAKLNASDAYARCLAAGRCNGLSIQSTAPTLKVPTPRRVDGPVAEPVPAPTGVAAEVPRVIEDCAVTTLMLNQLQADIERQ